MMYDNFIACDFTYVVTNGVNQRIAYQRSTKVTWIKIFQEIDTFFKIHLWLAEKVCITSHM